MSKKTSAVVLLSGGLDSVTAAAFAREAGFDVHALTFQYGQTHRFELEAARKVATHIHARRHVIFDVDLAQFGGSALVGDGEVPKDRSDDQISHGIPTTYVPARNTVFLSLALAWAETLNCHDIYIGVNAVDYSGYPDCRPPFIEAFTRMANLATRAGVEERQRLTIHTPLIAMTKAQIIRAGLGMGVDYAMTHTCYDPDDRGRACGRCDACQLRLKGFAACGIADPASYQSGVNPS